MNNENIPDRDEVGELADRLQAKQQRGEAWEFEIEFASFTDDERAQFMALMNERIAHGEEKLEAVRENVQVLSGLRDLVESAGTPPGTTLWEAGYIDVMQVVGAIHAVPDPLAE